MALTGMAAAPWPLRVVRAHPRISTGLLVSLLSYFVLPGALMPSARAVLAWDIGSLVLLVLAGVLFARGGGAMERAAAEQEEGEWTIFFIVLAGVVFSFVALTVVFGGVKDMTPGVRRFHIGLVAATLLLSWLVTHVVFAMRYAHEYYAKHLGGPGVDGGLEFPGGEPPDYWDFAYFAIVVGMTFQVSDVQITARKLRRLATVHGLIGFLFNTVIVALTVNIAASLLS